MKDIEKEAREIAIKHCGNVADYLGPDLEAQMSIYLAEDIAKALQAKQDRIEELSLRDVNIRENLILNLDEDMSKLRELSTEQLVCKAVTGIFWRDKDIKNLNKRIETLENELRAYDLDIYGADGAKEISNMRKRISELESALKPFIENYDKYGNHGPFAHGLFMRAKKAIGGGNEKGN